MNTELKAVNDAKANAWNQTIMPRAEAISAYLKADQWTKGVGAWLKAVNLRLVEVLKRGCKSRDDDQFIRGQLAMLDEIMDLPAMIEKILTEKENQKKQADSRGAAGY